MLSNSFTLGEKDMCFGDTKEADIMSNTLVQLKSIDDVKAFVNAAGKCDFDIDVKYNRIIVDAKSLLGVMSIFSNPFFVCSRKEDAAFNNFLEKYKIC